MKAFAVMLEFFFSHLKFLAMYLAFCDSDCELGASFSSVCALVAWRFIEREPTAAI